VSGLAYLGAAVVMAVVLSTLLWLSQRKPRSFLSSIDEFRRDMDALALRPGPRPGAGPGPPARGPRRPEPIVPAPGRGDLARKLRAARREAARQEGGRARDRPGGGERTGRER
jgi:hypothetical protein